MATAPAPSSLRRGGWTADSIRAGQYLAVTGRRSRDGGPMILLESSHGNGGAIVELDRADGSVVGALTGTEGNALSDRHTVVETHRCADDEIGPALEMVMAVSDPDYLAGSWELRWKKYFTSDYVFTELDCRLPFLAN